MWAPYLAWQAGHGWPELAVAASIANGGSGTSAPRWALLPYQFVPAGVFLSPVWATGLVRLLGGGALRWCRALGVAFAVLVVVFTVTGGKPYYLRGLLPSCSRPARSRPWTGRAGAGPGSGPGCSRRAWRSPSSRSPSRCPSPVGTSAR
jgi:hypothetical protein